jgi:hypothetical protein
MREFLPDAPLTWMIGLGANGFCDIGLGSAMS